MSAVLPEASQSPSSGRRTPQVLGIPPDEIDKEPSPRSRRRKLRATPYVLLLPSILAMGAVIGYPLYKVASLSMRKYGLRQLIRRESGEFVGLDNYRSILGDAVFRSAVVRTVLFALSCVAVTMVIATLVALMLRALGKKMRLLVSIGLLFTWAVPALTATIIWRWLFDTEFGVVNWLITALPGDADFYGHGWFLDKRSALVIIGAVVVWMGVPFVALTLHAGLAQIPDELFEAASIDGASAWRTFRSVTYPLLKPIFMILASLSTIWDIRVFTQVWNMTRGGPNKGTYMIGVYAYIESFASSRFDRGAAMAVLLVVLLLIVTAVYVRSLLKAIGEDGT
jgi:N,N'-diacetylchitobiose transport system permease protein